MIQGMYEVPSAAYAQALDTFEKNKVKRDMLLALADRKEKGSPERAKLLHEALQCLHENGVFQTSGYYGYKDEVDEIKKTDANNALGLRSTWEYYTLLISVSHTKLDESVKLITAFVDEFKGTDMRNAQRALFLKAYLYMQNQAQDRDTKAIVIEIMREVQTMDPKTDLGQKATEFLNSVNQAEPAPQEEETPKQ
jgi:hypothetical protein